MLYKIKMVVLRYANNVSPRLICGVIRDPLTKLKRNRVRLEAVGVGASVKSCVHALGAVEAAMEVWEKHKLYIRSLQHSVRRLDNS